MGSNNQTLLKILVTGASGFVGSHVLSVAHNKGYQMIAQSRSQQQYKYAFEQVLLDITPETDWQSALVGIDCVVHCAARVHQMAETEADALKAYRDVNTLGTLNLARQAALAGVKRFIFLSSIKVNGEQTKAGAAFQHDDAHIPVDPYGLSKFEAEVGLKKILAETEMEVVVIRPTLVYGPGVKANFASLLNLVSKGLLLPLGCITHNKRSLVAIDNLVDLIITCIDHPKAANQVFLASDDHDISTSEMVREMAIALGKPTWQLPVPIWCYKLAGKLFKKSEVVERLTGSLQVDITHTKQTLGWNPPQTLQQGFQQTAEAFLYSKNNSGKS
ncbi:SDR family oxidoreductase [Vibrio sp. dsl-7]|uniref:SDR family oxidoreductase n=1 Tax=Vibrio chanodichtyis TaxID=3027932 RepID=A0ABT5V1K9_9VIBR|nr:SDR family oxidoreductase [Vibrio chanodichtyis]MDE1515544.1 SDR family oxidoreductase [Vibrio chanodichtyis]